VNQPQPPLLEISELSATTGEWVVPPAGQPSLALALSDFHATWRGQNGKKTEDVSAGTVAICEPDQPRVFEFQDAAKFGFVLIRPKALEYASLQLEPHDTLDDPVLRRFIEVLLLEKRGGFPGGSLFLDSMATALATYLSDTYSPAPARSSRSTGGMAPAALRRVIEFMNANLTSSLRLGDLAREAGLSAAHLLRSFRQSTGKTPHQYLLDRRVERAQALMREPRNSLADVALSTGFANQHHLSRVFRRIRGVTPSAYRQSLR
jgi:AraC family transcriptional regulator